jgi:hypothetical protein
MLKQQAGIFKTPDFSVEFFPAPVLRPAGFHLFFGYTYPLTFRKMPIGIQEGGERGGGALNFLGVSDRVFLMEKANFTPPPPII